MRIGVTGSRNGLTMDQRAAFVDTVHNMVELRNFNYRPIEKDQLHHGACIGADEQMLLIAQNDFALWTVAHPSNLIFLTTKILSHETREPKPPLERNHDIVDATEILIATPETFEEVLRSGTWATIRYAKKIGRPIKYIWPDGVVTDREREKP